jgi:hypothetical protein
MFDQPNRFTFRGETYVVHHGDPFDRGSADSYYGRPRDPHRGGVGGDSGPRVSQLNEQELQEYHSGYDYNEQFGDKKNYL